jgi:hypothetical protein
VKNVVEQGLDPETASSKADLVLNNLKSAKDFMLANEAAIVK